MGPPIYLVRHGESEWNVRGLTQGQIAHPRLTARGRAQADCAAAKVASDLRRLGITTCRVVSSDLTRAAETAARIAAAVHIGYSVDPRLREQQLGRLEGLDVALTAGEENDWSDPTRRLGGGESIRQVQARIFSVLAELDPSLATVLVSHGNTISAVLAHRRGQRLQDTPRVHVPNGAVVRFDGPMAWL